SPGSSMGGSPGISTGPGGGGPGSSGGGEGRGGSARHSTPARGGYVDETVSVLTVSSPRSTTRVARAVYPSSPGTGVQSAGDPARRMSARGAVETCTEYSRVPHSRTVTELPSPEASITSPVPWSLRNPTSDDAVASRPAGNCSPSTPRLVRTSPCAPASKAEL